MATENNSRNLNDLRVSDLREELEKRGLDKSGVKSMLVKRLQQALSEDSDNTECTKDDSLTEKSEPAEEEMDTAQKEETNDEEMQDADNSLEIDPDDVDPSDLVVKDELDTSIGEENDTKEDTEEDAKEPVKENVELKTLEVKVENCIPKSRPGPASSKLNHSRQILETSRAESKAAENIAEQDDSINLTIGEDEEKLLQEADDGHHRSKGTDVKKQSKSQTGKQDQDSSKVDDRVSNDEEQSTEVSRESEETTTTVTATNGDKKKDDKSDSKTQQADGNTSSTVSKPGAKDDKDSTKKSSSISSSRNLWVSGLSGSTRATDLKQVFSKYGKVIGAKVVTSARTPGARCYGYVTMATNEEAVRCMHNLHRTELHGRVVSVERAKSDGTVPAKKDSVKSENTLDSKSEGGDKQSKTSEHDASRSIKSGDIPAGDEANEQTDKAGDAEGDAKKSDTKSISKDKDRSVSRKSRSKHDSKSRDRERSRSRRHKSDTSRERKMQVLSFKQIRAEREKQRMRDRERALREEERRRREEQLRNREVERWQREEAQRLAKEREKLQREREKIERERVEILKLERTRQKLERERLEFERMELKRQQIKIDEARMAAKRSAMDRRDAYQPHDERKRPAMGERRLEAPPPPRFDQVSSSVGAGPGSKRSGYNDVSDVLSSKRDYNKREDLRKNESRGGEFKRGGEFDILPRHSSSSGGHMMHPSHASSHQGSIIKYPVQSYDDRGRDNSDIGGSRQDSSSAGPMQSSRSKESSRYAERSSDRPSERGSGLSYRGSERDNGRRQVEAPDHRSSGNKLPPRGGSRERRYVDSNIKDSGRYNDRPNSTWHAPGGSSSSKPYGSLSSSAGGMNTGQNIVSNNPWANDSRSKPTSQNQSSAWRQVDSASNDRYDDRYVSVYKPTHQGGLTKGNQPLSSFSRDYAPKPNPARNNVQRQVTSYQKSSYY